MLFVSICLFLDLPYSQIFSGGGQDVFLASFDIWDPHYFSWWKLVFEFINFSEAFVWLFKVQINDVDLIVHRVSVITRYRHLKFIILTISKSYRVILESTVVCINLFCFSFFRKMVDFVHDFVGLAL